MANVLFPKRGVAHTFYVGLVSQADTKLLQSNPTLATGDVKISKDGGAFANLATLPDVFPASGTAVRVQLSASEMTADNIVVAFVDAAGAEWCGQLINIQTVNTGADWIAQIIADLLNTVNTTSTFNGTNTVGRQIRTGAGTSVGIRSGTAQGGAANTITLDAQASSTNNLYQGHIILITSGVGAGQSRRIITYNGATKVATVDRDWVTIPTNTSVFDLQASTAPISSHEGTAQAGAAGSITLATSASSVNNFYVPSLVTITAGTGAGQTREITGYNGTTKVATVDTNWSVTPDNTSIYAVIPSGGGTTAQTDYSSEFANLASLIQAIDTGVNDPPADAGNAAGYYTPQGVFVKTNPRQGP